MRLQTLTAAVLVAVVATYLFFAGQGPTFTETGGGFGALDAVGAVEEFTAGGATIVVHVSGAVVRPGIVELPEGARIADAVAAAGGATRPADLGGINLAAPISDGDHLVVPDRHGVAAGAPPATEDPASSGRIRLNTATVGQLIELPGIGPVLAERIVRHREQQGPFVAIEDLLDVAGIGEAKLLELRELVEV